MNLCNYSILSGRKIIEFQHCAFLRRRCVGPASSSSSGNVASFTFTLGKTITWSSESIETWKSKWKSSSFISFRKKVLMFFKYQLLAARKKMSLFSHFFPLSFSQVFHYHTSLCHKPPLTLPQHDHV